MGTSLSASQALALDVAHRIRVRRLHLGWSQKELAHRAGMPVDTYIRLERTGQSSFERVLQVLVAIGLRGEISNIASGVPMSIDPIGQPKLQRGRSVSV